MSNEYLANARLGQLLEPKSRKQYVLNLDKPWNLIEPNTFVTYHLSIILMEKKTNKNLGAEKEN